MSFRLAINGYGRIGQCVLRALYENGYRHKLEVVAINELSDLDTLAYLTRYDTTHGRFPAKVATEQDQLIVAGDRIKVLHESEPANINWRDLGIDLLLECSGSFKERTVAEQHLESGATKTPAFSTCPVGCGRDHCLWHQ